MLDSFSGGRKYFLSALLTFSIASSSHEQNELMIGIAWWMNYEVSTMSIILLMGVAFCTYRVVPLPLQLAMGLLPDM